MTNRPDRVTIHPGCVTTRPARVPAWLWRFFFGVKMWFEPDLKKRMAAYLLNVHKHSTLRREGRISEIAIIAFCLCCLTACGQSTNTNAPPLPPTNTPPSNVVKITPVLIPSPNVVTESSNGVVQSQFVPATLEWAVIQEPWQDVPQLNIEQAVISSNLVAAIVWKGHTNYTVVERIPLRTVTRKYSVERTKHYDQ